MTFVVSLTRRPFVPRGAGEVPNIHEEPLSSHAGAPLPEGADAVVQIENTEKLPPGSDGQQRVRIVKVFAFPSAGIFLSILHMNFACMQSSA